MYNFGAVRQIKRVILFSLVLAVAGVLHAQSPARRISVWLIPSENAGPNDVAQGSSIPAQMEALRKALLTTRVRLLNVEDPLAMKARSWNPEFNVPNFQVVATQKKTLKALEKFADRNQVDIVVRFVTWDEAFALLNSDRAAGPDALPDVAQIGTTWAGHFAAEHRIQPRPNWQSSRGSWRDVLGVPACALPYTNDVRLLFYWKRLPSSPPNSQPLTLSGASWESILDSLRDNASVGDTVALATGVTLNLLHDYATLVWAGPDQKFVSAGLLGPSVDLVSKGAISVPTYLASHTRIALGNNEYRRLISFPESTHEEVTRTFVNGGYRATLEPANFIGRWAEDFAQRQNNHMRAGDPKRSFWDYAAAIVPPGSFRGGSELVVLRNAADPDLAFSLADYLASDPEYTQVLAEAGLLPSGRPGYGIDALVRSLQPEGADRGAQAFIGAVQKAIDQGHKYPDIAQWPTVVENRVVLEELQRVWRRMAEGDVDAMRQAADDVQWAINSHIYVPARAWDSITQWWPLLLALALTLAAYGTWTYWLREQSWRRLITVLHLYRAGRHESSKILGPNLAELVLLGKAGKLSCEQLNCKLSDLANHYVKRLNPYIGQLGDDLVREVQEPVKAVPLKTIICAAWDGAIIHYQAKQLMDLPDVSLATSGLDGYVMRRYPAMAQVILQEWFYNCLNSVVDVGTQVLVRVEGRAIIVLSRGHLNDGDLSTITGPPSRGMLKANAHGLVVIRDIAHYAFRTRVAVEQCDGQINLSLLLPVDLR